VLQVPVGPRDQPHDHLQAMRAFCVHIVCRPSGTEVSGQY
jgi:hypothetical protein